MISEKAIARLVGQRRTLMRGPLAGIPATVTAVLWWTGPNVMLVLTYDEGVNPGPKVIHGVDALLSETRKLRNVALTYTA